MNWLCRNRHRTKHEYVAERLSAYLDCELKPEERAAVEQHLDECEECRWDVETLRQTVEWTRDCAPVRLPRVFTIPVETGAPQVVRGRRPAQGLPLLQGATALVALLFVVVVAGDLLVGRSTPQSMPQMVASQPTAAMDQAAAPKQIVVTQVVEMQAAATMVVEAGAPAAAEALPSGATVPPPSAPEVLSMAVPTPTAAAEVGGLGGGEPALSVTMEAMAATIETLLEAPQGAPKVGVTSEEAMAFTATTPLLTQPLTVQITLTMWVTPEHMPIGVAGATATAAAAAYPEGTAAPTQDLLLLPTAEPMVEIAAPAPAPDETTGDRAQQGAETRAVTEQAYDAVAPTNAPAAAPQPNLEPAAIAAAPQAREAAQVDRAGEEPGIVGTLRETVAPWFSLAEIVLGAVFVLLALVTTVVMLRWQPR